jgi:adenylate kinase family enzyme
MSLATRSPSQGVRCQEALLDINVVGTSGSGKTHFSRRLAARLGVRCVELDALFWQPGWVESGDEEFLARIAATLAEGPFVLDGNYTRSIPVKWRTVRTVIWLDYSFALTLRRAIGRALHRCWTQQELWPGTGNRERWRALFSRDSIVWWTIRTHARTRRNYETLQNDPRYAHIRFIRLRNPREAEAWLSSLPT